MLIGITVRTMSETLRPAGYLPMIFFGGNLAGIVEKLQYLQELGVTALYLNPIFESPSNHKYDTADYKKVDEMFGDNAGFAELCGLAKAAGINIILDGVFSPIQEVDSVYFNRYGRYDSLGAYQSQASPYYGINFRNILTAMRLGGRSIPCLMSMNLNLPI